MDILKSMGHPDEIFALLRFKLGGYQTTKSHTKRHGKNYKKCYEFLTMTSRSFAAVIQALDGELRHAVCIFYLVLRALDTVEDDMSLPVHVKVPMLKAFHTYLLDPEWRFMDSTEKDKPVLEDFPVISAEFRALAPMYREVISDICRQMGDGMTVYLERSPDSMQEWDEYCHYVAGLVGIGLSRLFSASELEDKLVGEDVVLSNSMGLFLQKTNIIRDYLEDVEQGREFWPQETWGKYASEMKDLAQPNKEQDALACLNELVTNALKHIPDCLTYMSRLKNQSVFNFCAIPQVMAIATLERLYNNHAVFRGVVKIRKGEAVKMMMSSNNMEAVKAIMTHFCTLIQARIPSHDPSASATHSITSHALGLSQTVESYRSSVVYYPLYVSFTMMLAAILWNYWTGVLGLLDKYEYTD